MSRTRVKDGSANPNPGPCGEIVPLKEFLANSVAHVASAAEPLILFSSGK